MIGLDRAHTWFDQRLMSKMGLYYPGVVQRYENQQFTAQPHEVFLVSKLNNSAADTKPLDLGGSAYRYGVQYEVQCFIPEDYAVREQERMIESISIWFNALQVSLGGGVKMDTHYTSVTDTGARDSRFIRTAKVPAVVYVNPGCNNAAF